MPNRTYKTVTVAESLTPKQQGVLKFIRSDADGKTSKDVFLMFRGTGRTMEKLIRMDLIRKVKTGPGKNQWVYMATEDPLTDEPAENHASTNFTQTIPRMVDDVPPKPQQGYVNTWDGTCIAQKDAIVIGGQMVFSKDELWDALGKKNLDNLSTGLIGSFRLNQITDLPHHPGPGIVRHVLIEALDHYRSIWKAWLQMNHTSEAEKDLARMKLSSIDDAKTVYGLV